MGAYVRINVRVAIRLQPRVPSKTVWNRCSAVLWWTLGYGPATAENDVEVIEPSANALDDMLGERLWGVSESLLGAKYSFNTAPK
jgi:hypothetical protein